MNQKFIAVRLNVVRKLKWRSSVEENEECTWSKHLKLYWLQFAFDFCISSFALHNAHRTCIQNYFYFWSSTMGVCVWASQNECHLSLVVNIFIHEFYDSHFTLCTIFKPLTLFLPLPLACSESSHSLLHHDTSHGFIYGHRIVSWTMEKRKKTCAPSNALVCLL